MLVSNFGSSAAVILAIFNECIKIFTPNYEYYSFIIAIIVSILWIVHNKVTNNTIGIISALFFTGINFYYLHKHLHDTKHQSEDSPTFLPV
jgi:TctA family transporter